MIGKQLRYYFNYIDKCNMCGSGGETHKILGKRLNQSQGKNPKTKIGITTTIIKCTDCGLIYSNPQPVPFDIQDHYGVPPEDYWKESYFVVNENYFAKELKQLKQLIDIKSDTKALDIGTGLGKAMIAMSKSGLDTYGFEPSKQFHERAISKMGINPERLKLGMIEDMDYPENYFDFISFGAVLEHLYDPSASIEKALKWLKPNGVMYIEVPSSNWLISKILNLYYKIKLTDYVSNLSPMHDPYHLYEFGVKSFELHAKKNNYELAYYEFDVCQAFMPKFLDYFLRPLMRKTNTGMQLCMWLRKK